MALQPLCIQEQLRGLSMMFQFEDSMEGLFIHGKVIRYRTFASVPTNMIRHNRCAV